MKIKLTTVYVNDQDRALRFYTEVLGMTTKADVRNGPYRWLTVVSPDDPDGTDDLPVGVHIGRNDETGTGK